MTYSFDITLQLSDTMVAEATVWFVCTCPGWSGDLINPPEGPEFEVEEVEVQRVFGETYERLPGDWAEGLDRQARWLVGEYEDDIYDHFLDAYNASWEPSC